VVEENTGYLPVDDNINAIQNLATDKLIMKEAGFIEIYVNNQAQTPVYYDNMMVTHSGGNVVEVNAYYPYGMRIPLLSTPDTENLSNLYLYNGKELQTELDLQWFDFGARPYDPTGRLGWLLPDPLAEKYYSTSPYAYCLNNPVKYIDPDGREVFITGALSEEALKQLQAKMKDRITLTKNEETGRLTYTINEGQKLKGDAKRMAGMIDNETITVNLITTNKNETSTGNLMIGGAFMGNTVTTDANGNVTNVTANQEVNPKVLGKADEIKNTTGKNMMHEATEAYAGARISQRSGVSSPASNAEGSVFQKAHNRATSQTPIYETIYDSRGNVLQMLPGNVYPNNISRAEWHVQKWFRKKIIQTIP